MEAAWEAEIGKRIHVLDSGAAKTISWAEVRKRNLAKLPHAHEHPSRQTVQLHEEAAAEYDEAFDWYLSRSPNTALRFDAEVERGLAQIALTPHRWPQYFHETHKYLLTDFPFILVYRESITGVIQILAIAHTSRNASKFSLKAIPYNALCEF